MKKTFKYEEVVYKIEEIIERLKLISGDKIPSVRSVSQELSVSITTVFQAYSILEARGVIISKPRSGYYLSAPLIKTLSRQDDNKFIALPTNVEVNTMATTMMKNAKEYGVINFSILSVANEFLPLAKISKAVQASLKENDNFQYPLVIGHPRLIRQIARQSFEWKNSLHQDNILITNGCMEAINLCLDAVTNRGDIVAVEKPTYHGILQSLESRGLKALEITTDPETGLNLDALQNALNHNKVSACVFQPVCHNPLGCSMPEANKMRLVEMLGERNIPLIEDDAMGELTFGQKRQLPAKAYDSYNNVLYCSSFSKTLVSGFRIGWLSAGKYQSKVEKLKFDSNISTAGILQDSIGRFMESGHYDSHLRKMRTALQENLVKYLNSIKNHFPNDAKISVPKGGLSLWIELDNWINTIDLQRLALEKGIGICPGDIFCASPILKNFIRLNYCPVWNFKIDKAIQKLGELINAKFIESSRAFTQQ
jgi:DNA-binding transcriptional MocR family regulator